MNDHRRRDRIHLKERNYKVKKSGDESIVIFIFETKNLKTGFIC